MRLNPLTVKKLKRFRSIKRGYYSLVALVVLYVVSLFAELLINSRALVVSYEGKWYFPTYSAFRDGEFFGEDYKSEADYRALDKKFEEAGEGDWVLMPPVRFNAVENDYREGLDHPTPPSFSTGHLLGTDSTGRDVLARLFYGFRIVMTFAIAFTFLVYIIGMLTGCAMGYFGGLTDLLGQRLVEIVGVIPFLYIVIIAVSLIPGSVGNFSKILVLLLIMVAFSWTGLTYYMRTATYKEKARDYVSAARVLGAGTWRVVRHHILPNTISTLVTFLPFMVAGAIASLTALDFLGFGLPSPTPSWGQMLEAGLASLEAPWIVTSAFCAIAVVLVLVTFVGEAVREAFDPKKYTVYR